MRAIALEGIVRPYAWGSPTAIPHLLGVEPDGTPVAELWFGAHPDDPSPTPRGSLDQLIADDPSGLLGASVVAQFGPRLPFLLKLLAAGSALSIQVHPTLAQARAGFAAGDPNYRDANHKPELIYALSEFDALCGFRPLPEVIALLDELDLRALDAVRALVAAGDRQAAFTRILDDPAPPARTVSAAVAQLGTGWAPTARVIRLAATDFPDDVGLVVALLLNPVRLRAGEALFLPAGNVHAYLRGLGVEIMANSDNVLRCGLTPKRIDVPELVRITDFSTLADPQWPADDAGFGPNFDVPVPDFALSVIDLDSYKGSAALGDTGPIIGLCLSGRVDLDGVELSPGRAAFVPAREAAVTARGTGRLAVATTGRQI